MGDRNIFIAETQVITRAGISSIISDSYDSSPVIEQFPDRQKLFNRLLLKHPDVLIIDFDWLDSDTVHELAEIKKTDSKPGILVIISSQSLDKIHQILDWGITSCVLKSCEKQELIDAVNATADNRKYFCSGVLNVLLAKRANKRKYSASPDRITPSEQEIIQLIARGLTSKEIAAKKNLSYHTIITHRKNIFRKLAINNSSELMLYAMHSGMIEEIDYSI